MASLPPASVPVDLSRLPKPQVIETLGFDPIKARLLAKFQQLVEEDGGSFTALVESDPAYKLIEAFAYEILLLRQNFNERAVSMLLPYATGADLENMAAYFGVARLAGETDERLLRRVQLAPDGYSVAGPESAYIFHALTADVTIADATATMIAPGEVLISILGEAGDGSATPAQIAAVEAVLTHGEVRPLTDLVTVASAEVIPYAIHARLTIAYGPDRSLVLDNARASLDAYLAKRRRIGRLVSATGHAGAIQVEGVETLDQLSPAADIPISRSQFAWPASILIEAADA